MSYNIDTIIDKLLEVRNQKPGRQIDLSEPEIIQLCQQSKELFMSQPIMLKINAPLKICGK